MTVRAFPEVPIQYGAKSIKAMQIVCVGCKAVAYFPHQQGHHRKPPIAATQHFQNKGWSIGTSARKDWCAECVRRGKHKKGIPMTDQASHPVAEPPREMSREERRIINDKLDEVYGRDAYKAPWTDSAVARDLGVPRDWVAQVRETFFGAEGSNPAFEEFLQRSVQITDAIAEIRADRVNLDKKCTDLIAKVDELQRIGKRLEREIGK